MQQEGICGKLLKCISKNIWDKNLYTQVSNIYGKYSKFKTSIASFIKSILKNKININGGNQYRDFYILRPKVIDKLIFSKKFENFNKFPFMLQQEININ